MVNLIRIEFMKLKDKKIIWVSLILSCIVVVAFGYFLKIDFSSKDKEITEQEKQLQEDFTKSKDWKEQMKIQMKLNMYLSDLYGEDEIKVKNEILQYKIEHNLKPYKEDTAWEFASYTIQIIGFLITIFAIVFAVEILVNEFNNKTVKQLFIKPYSRTKIILAKYIVSVIFSMFLALFVYLAAVITGGVIFTFKGGNTYTAFWCFKSIIKCSLIVHSLIYLLSTVLNTIILVTIAFFITICCKSQVIPIITSLGILFFGKTVTDKIFTAGFKEIRFSILANLNPISYFNKPVSSEYSLVLMAIVVIIHLAILLLGGVFIVKKSDY